LLDDTLEEFTIGVPLGLDTPIKDFYRQLTRIQSTSA
jgi:hypothetical protein